MMMSPTLGLLLILFISGLLRESQYAKALKLKLHGYNRSIIHNPESKFVRPSINILIELGEKRKVRGSIKPNNRPRKVVQGPNSRSISHGSPSIVVTIG
ncbi:unnamed protein product, partial [Iphiclides podalirius]